MISYLLNRWVYIAVALLFTGASVLEYFFTKKKKLLIVVLIVLLFIFFLLGILKGQSVGLDTHKYTETYIYVGSLNDPLTFIAQKFPEVIFYSFMALFACVFKSPEILFWILEYGTICIFLFFSFIKLDRPIFKLSVFMFMGFFMMSLSGIRQSISIAIGTYAIIYFIRNIEETSVKKYIIYYILTVLATGIHEASIILAVLPLLFLIKFNKKTFIIWVPLLLFLPSILSRIFSFVSSNINVYYFPYDYNVSITFILTIILLFFVFIVVRDEDFFTNIFKKFNYAQPEFDTKLNSYIWVVYFSLVFLCTNVFSLVVPRYSMFLYIGTVEIIAMLLGGIKNNYIRLALTFLTVSFFGVYFVVRASTLGIVPYVFM